MLTEKQITRFWSKVDKGDGTGCWLWTGRLDRDGYGVLTVVLSNGRREQRANRIAWIIENGIDLAPGRQALHHCDTPSCVRVGEGHIFEGSAADNMNDKNAKGRWIYPGPMVPSSGDRHWTRLYPEKVLRGDQNPSRTKIETRPRGGQHWSRLRPERVARGQKHGRAKLTVEQVIELRRLCASGHTHAQLSSLFGVSRSQVQMIVYGKNWKHV